MANPICTPTDDTRQILNLLPPLPSIQRLVDLIMGKVADVRNKYVAKISDLILELTSLPECPPASKLRQVTQIGNRLVNQLSNLYNSVNRTADSISGVTDFINIILTIIRTASGVARGLSLGTIVSPFPIPGAISSGISAAQGEIENLKFKGDGTQKLVPLQAGINSANIAIQLFVNSLKELICKLEELDFTLQECINNLSEAEKEELQLDPIDPAIIDFVEQSVAENTESVIETTYRGFIFEIQKIPFSPTVDRTRAVALNQSGIALLESELSFTKDPSVLIEELKFVIDRDNLRAD